MPMTARRRSMVSVIVPCFNAAGTLADCLDSLFGQDRPPDEVVLLDDGSTDATAAVVRRYDARLHYHFQQRRGAGAARNAAVRLAGGDVLGFLDADDVWPADSLQARLEVLEADPAVAAVTGLVEHFRSGGRGYQGAAVLPGVQPTRLVCAMLARRGVFDQIGGFDESGRLGEQFDWVARLAESGLRTEMLNQIVWRRRVHARNTGTLRRAERGDYLHVLKSVLDRRRAVAARSG
jgi:glycosyltransferase involved in cell wall biosynthesis